MLKAIRKFVLERSRDIRQRPQEVVEEHTPSHPSGESDVVLEVAAPQSEEPSEMPVRGKVKWFNSAKRFGFVELSDGSGDVFLHTSVLSRFASAPFKLVRPSTCGWLQGSGVLSLPKLSEWTAARRSRSSALEPVFLPHTTDRSRRRVFRRRVQ